MPTATQQLTNTALLSTLNTQKPIKRNKLYQPYGNVQGLYDLLETLGWDRMVAGDEVSHFEQPWIWETIKVKNTVADQGAGNSIDITLHSDSLDSNNNFYPQVNDKVNMPASNNYVKGQITEIDTSSPTAPVLTIHPLNDSQTLGGVSSDDTIVIYSNQWAEGTGQPDNIVTHEDELKFPASIVKGAVEATGSAMATQLWYDTLSIGGKDASNKYKLSTVEEDIRMKARIEAPMWLDEKTTNSSVNGKSMWGIFDFINNGGNVSEITPGQFTMTDFDVMENTLDQEQAPNEMYGCLGTRLYQNVENALSDYFNSGAVVYANFLGNKGKTAQDVNMDFKSIEKSGRKYHLQKMSLFNHPKLFNASGYNYGSWGVFMPLDIRKQKTPSGDARMPSISKFYVGQKRYSRKMEVWRTGAADGVYTNEVDKQKTNYRGHVGLELFGSNRWYLIKAKSA